MGRKNWKKFNTDLPVCPCGGYVPLNSDTPPIVFCYEDASRPKPRGWHVVCPDCDRAITGMYEMPVQP